MAKIACPYCNTLNESTNKTCVGCGAPLEAPAAQPVVQPVQQAFRPVQTTSPFSSTDTARKVQDGAQQAEKLFTNATAIYHTAWSITGDAIAIAIVAFILGVAGGATNMKLWGVLGAMLVGLFIGYADQSFWMTILAAPAGALAGIVVGAFLWGLGAGPKSMVFIATALACVGALIGSRPHTARLGCTAAIRPLLGAGGAFFFSLLGLLIGMGIRAVL